MVNYQFNLASTIGIVLAVAGAALYFLRNVRPELARDHDIFFAAVGLLSGFILIFQGWRFDPIMQFGQLLLSGATIFFAVESVRLRSVATEQAKRNTKIVDEDRPVSQVYEYEAELDDYEPLEEERPIPRRQIRGTRDSRPARIDEYEDEAPRRYRRDEDNEYPRRSSTRPSSSERLAQGDRPRTKRRTRPESRPSQRPETDEWSYREPQTNDEDWEASTTSRTNRSSRPASNGSSRVDRTENVNSEAPPRPRRRRSTSESAYRQNADAASTPSDYVDYKPIERSNDDRDNSANFDDEP